MYSMTTSAATLDAALGKKVVLFGLLSIAATLGIMSLAMGVSDVFVSSAILGILLVAAILIHPVLGIVTLLGTLLLGLPGFLAGTGRLSANNLLGLILAAVLAMQLCMKRDFWFVRTPQVILLLLIVAAFVTSLVHSWHIYVPVQRLPRDYTENTLFLLFSRFAFLLMFVNFVKTPRHVILILVSLLALTMVVLPSVFYNLATQTDEVDVITGKATEFRVSADISSWGKNENRLAFMCNISILMIWMFAHICKVKVVRFVATPVILLLAFLVLKTVSRSGFLSLGLVLLFLLSQRGLALSLRFGVIGGVMFCAVVFFLLLPPKASQRLLNLSPDQSERTEGWRSTQSRVETNQHSLEIFRSAPLFGVGPGNFMWVHRVRYPYTLAAGRPNHNSYLWAATEGGTLAIFMYLLLFFFIWRDLAAAQQTYAQDHQSWHVTRFLKGYLMIFLFFSVFADFWLEPHLYLLAGLSMLMRRWAMDQESSHPTPMAVANASVV